MIESIEAHQLYEEELKKSEPSAVMLGYNRQKIKLIHESLIKVKNLLSLEHDNSEVEYEFELKDGKVHLIKKND